MHHGLDTATRIHLDDANSDIATSYLDPLDPDTVQDLPLVVTRRQLIRLAVVSTEVGARFQREAVDRDSMAWMLAPRILFDGRDAIEASLEQRHCIRALVLHGLGLGLDAHPSDIDDLMSDGAKGGRSRRDRSTRSKRKAPPVRPEIGDTPTPAERTKAGSTPGPVPSSERAM